MKQPFFGKWCRNKYSSLSELKTFYLFKRVNFYSAFPLCFTISRVYNAIRFATLWWDVINTNKRVLIGSIAFRSLPISQAQSLSLWISAASIFFYFQNVFHWNLIYSYPNWYLRQINHHYMTQSDYSIVYFKWSQERNNRIRDQLLDFLLILTFSWYIS